MFPSQLPRSLYFCLPNLQEAARVIVPRKNDNRNGTNLKRRFLIILGSYCASCASGRVLPPRLACCWHLIRPTVIRVRQRNKKSVDILSRNDVKASIPESSKSDTLILLDNSSPQSHPPSPSGLFCKPNVYTWWQLPFFTRAYYLKSKPLKIQNFWSIVTEPWKLILGFVAIWYRVSQTVLCTYRKYEIG